MASRYVIFRGANFRSAIFTSMRFIIKIYSSDTSSISENSMSNYINVNIGLDKDIIYLFLQCLVLTFSWLAQSEVLCSAL